MIELPGLVSHLLGLAIELPGLVTELLRLVMELPWLVTELLGLVIEFPWLVTELLGLVIEFPGLATELLGLVIEFPGLATELPRLVTECPAFALYFPSNARPSSKRTRRFRSVAPGPAGAIVRAGARTRPDPRHAIRTVTPIVGHASRASANLGDGITKNIEAQAFSTTGRLSAASRSPRRAPGGWVSSP